MPIPLDRPPPDARIDALLAAQATKAPPGEPGVAPCPLMQKEAEAKKAARKKKPIRMLFWHLYELGGGFHMPPVRPGYAVQACARLIQTLDVHLVVLQGLTCTLEELPSSQSAGTASYISLESAPRDSGPEEAKRILEQLQQFEPGAGWQIEFPRIASSGQHLYHRWTTAAFLYASSKGLTFQKLDLVSASMNADAGVSGTLVSATFDAPDFRSTPVCVMTPLGLTTPERPWEKLRVPAKPEDRAPTAPMPDSAIVFVSAPGDASKGIDQLHEQLDAEYVPPSPEGTVLGDEFWKTVSETKDGLLGNFAAINLGNVLLQDQEMHWEALKEPEHAKSAERLSGTLSDGMSIVNHGAAASPKVREHRVIDLIAASLPPASVDALKAGSASKTATGKPPPETGVLLELRRTYRAESVSGPEPERDPKNDLAECAAFSRMLSRHFPLLTELQLESE